MSRTPVWTDDQREVIIEDSRSRLLVDAGPGTGKTAVLCARIAWLIDHHGVTPENIWVISFTRTAVAELRTRIASFLGQREKSSGVRIATVDSYSWSINSGFRADASISGSFDENISNVIKLIEHHEGVFEYLDSVEHLFFDEAQDIVGLRCELLLSLISSIRRDSGLTIFCDEAQAIYGFAQNNKSEVGVGSFPEILCAKKNIIIERKSLSTIHRTDDPVLKQLNQSGRALLLSDKKSKEKFHLLRGLITQFNHGQSPVVAKCNSSMFSDNYFLLFRKRGEALASIKELSDVSLRVRMNGYANLVKPWIAEIFWDWTRSRIKKDEFLGLWDQRAKSKYDEDAAEEWTKLVRFFGRSAFEVDVERLNARLASQSPPVELCDEYVGSSGPLVTTIHSSKGRESDSVCLYLSPPELQSFAMKQNGWGSDDPVLEEAKVLFVGATRARHRLYVAEVNGGNIHNLKRSGRAYQEIGERLTSINIEVGRKDDIQADGLVGKDLFDSQYVALAAQKRISSLYKSYVMGDARKSAACFGMCLQSNPDVPLVFLSKAFDYALKEFLYERHLKSHGSILSGLRVFGTRTLAVSQEARVRMNLHHPWAISGFMFAPVIVGFASIRVSSKWGGI